MNTIERLSETGRNNFKANINWVDNIIRNAETDSGNLPVTETPEPVSLDTLSFSDEAFDIMAEKYENSKSEEKVNSKGSDENIQKVPFKKADIGQTFYTTGENTSTYNELNDLVALNLPERVPDIGYSNKPEKNPLENEIVSLFNKNKHIPKSGEAEYLQFSWDLEKFAQKHHSKKDLENFNKMKDDYTIECDKFNQPNRNLSKSDCEHRNEIKKTLTGMTELENNLKNYNLNNFKPEKVNDAKTVFGEYEKLSITNPAKADENINKFLKVKAQDPETKKVIKTLCYDTKNEVTGKKIYNKASHVESEEIFKSLQQKFPIGLGRGSCGTCADKVETVLKGMDLQYHSYQRIQGSKPVTHIATELIEKKFDNSQKVSENNNIVLDMWLIGKNAFSGFNGLDYDAFLDPTMSDPDKMGAYWRNFWPIRNGTPSGGTIR